MVVMKTWMLSACLAAALACPGFAQLGRQQGLLDPNVATEKELAAVPGLQAGALKALLAARPFANVVELNKFLLTQSLTQAQIDPMYKNMFLHINLNTASREEILLVPGAGTRMAREFAEYRPYASYEKFRKEIGKYVDAAEVARLEQYTFIAIDLNTATDGDILSIPGAGARMVREFKEYRPYANLDKFRKEIGKYVNPKEVARLERYVFIK
jgi:DNA uptake protein ComE-like DNA-binding protein